MVLSGVTVPSASNAFSVSRNIALSRLLFRDYSIDTRASVTFSTIIHHEIFAIFQHEIVRILFSELVAPNQHSDTSIRIINPRSRSSNAPSTKMEISITQMPLERF
ncbi:hypothetical protein PM082_014801 [Marasmius tenuissimus]|nr:hypothetical protein PM082_014801 [Marasmius tenuissimus]